MHPQTARTLIAGLASAAALVLAGLVLPGWLLFTATKALGTGLVALGLVALMRGGLVSFGQGLVYCLGAYTAGLLSTRAGVTDAALLLLAGGLLPLLAGLAVGPLIARYRGIFFAMLTVALAMVLYGVLVKMPSLGGSDGFTLPEPTFLGWVPGTARGGDLALYALAALIAAGAATAARVHFDSMPGLLALAVRENELRVEYLGASAFAVTVRNFAIAAGLGGLGGTINALALGHVDPLFAFWTTSGEFVFIAVLAGHLSVAAAFVAALILELVRSYAGRYFPDTWQLILGTFLLVTVIFLPRGIGSLWAGRKPRAASARGASEKAPAE